MAADDVPVIDVTTSDRCDIAEQVIQLYIKLTGDAREDALADLLGDLMHWAELHDNAFSFYDELDRGAKFRRDELRDDIATT